MPASPHLVPEWFKDRWVLRGRLLHYEGGALPTSYRWFRLSSQRPFTLTVANVNPFPAAPPAAIAPVRILVSDRSPEPPRDFPSAQIACHAPLGSDITIPYSYIWDAPFEWITAVTTGAGDPVAVDLAAG
jgi:hypothetical protein